MMLKTERNNDNESIVEEMDEVYREWTASQRREHQPLGDAAGLVGGLHSRSRRDLQRRAERRTGDLGELPSADGSGQRGGGEREAANSWPRGRGGRRRPRWPPAA